MAVITFTLTMLPDDFAGLFTDASLDWMDATSYTAVYDASTGEIDITIDTDLLSTDFEDAADFYVATDGVSTTTVTEATITLRFTTIPTGMSATTTAHVFVYPATVVDNATDIPSLRYSPQVVSYDVAGVVDGSDLVFEVLNIADFLLDFVPRMILVVFTDDSNYYVRRYLLDLL